MGTLPEALARHMKKKKMTGSQLAKAAHSGKDIGKKGKHFDSIAAKAAKEYGSVAAGKRVAGAIQQRLYRKG